MIWINKLIVLQAHDTMIMQFGGSYGIRDEGLLESALIQPQQAFHYKEPKPDLYDLAAKYAYHLVKNHAFIDGNKRTALSTCLAFLEINGINTNYKEPALFYAIKELAASTITEFEFSSFLKAKNSTN
ncbi:Death on curing protein (plasmid) [Piscirickettsia salmonis]|uniref:type II toxin-antitoxin system death-on-curing family toxin n=2 Tax=Piscirickettsia salmonis TaxID=1238 RepID=UPI0012B74003|nr:type II toxin-antitoxin system death-on-curing family toxin [Piscirickettsia salmonis]QGP51342.1 Death on curing protein [Piscirickettsia salmonis]QGP52203.1 Death on curing protein [Piscirickettsia salmonis]